MNASLQLALVATALLGEEYVNEDFGFRLELPDGWVVAEEITGGAPGPDDDRPHAPPSPRRPAAG